MKKILFILFALFYIFPPVLEPAAAASVDNKTYPQIRLGGYKKWYYSKLDVAPTRNYFPALDDSLTQGGFGSGPWAENLGLNIQAEVAKDWTLHYGLWQLEGLPDDYTIRLKYKNIYFSAGDQKQLLAGQQLLVQDRVSGYGFRQKFSRIDLTLVSGDYPKQGLNSQVDYTGWKEWRGPGYAVPLGTAYYLDNQELEFLGLELGRLDIVPESVEVFLDGRPLIEGATFFIDTDYGLVLFPQTYGHMKKARVVYNSMDGKRAERIYDLEKEAKRRAFLSPELRIIDGSEVLLVDGVRKSRDIDYKVNYTLGLIIMREPLAEDADVRIDYEYTYGSAVYGSEVITGQVGTVIDLSRSPVVENSETLVKNGQALSRGSDYSITYSTGRVNLALPLTAADTLEASYSFYGVGRSATAFNTEYQLAPWSKIGISLAEVRSDTAYPLGRNGIPNISSTTYNFYGQTVINQDTMLRAEYAMSNLKENPLTPLGSSSSEADSALILSGRTRWGAFGLEGSHRQTGLDFPTVRKVKSNTGWKEKKTDLALKYTFSDDLLIKYGIGQSLTQQGTASSPEASDSVLSLGMKYQQLNWDLEMDYRINRQDLETLPAIATGRQTSLFSRLRLDLDGIFTQVRGVADQMDLIGKSLLSSKDGEILQGTFSGLNEETQKLDLGWLTKYHWGASSYFLWTIENGKNNTAGTSYDRVTPLLRLSYLWTLGPGNDLEISYDYSRAQQRGSTAYNKVSQGSGFTWKLLLENPVLSEFRFQGIVNTFDYFDLNDSDNDYCSTTTYFSGALVF